MTESGTMSAGLAPDADLPAPPDFRQRRMIQVAETVRYGTAGTALTFLVLGLCLSAWGSWTQVVFWYVTAMASHLLVAANAKLFLDAAEDELADNELVVWAIRMAAFSALYNLCWASLIIQFWVPGDLQNNYFLMTVLAVSIAPATIITNSFLPSYLVAVGSISTLLLGHILALGDPSFIPIAAVHVVFMISMTMYALRMNKDARQSAQLIHEKSDLIDALKSAKRSSDMARAKAEDASRAKSQFLANMSHELRTPLNAIIGFSEVMMAQIFGPLRNDKYLQYSRDIHSSGEHLLGLINDVLDISKIEAGQYTIAEDQVDFDEVADDCLKLIELRAQANNVEIVMRRSGALPELLADQRAVRQIWLNLLTNAVKFAPPGSQIHMIAYVRADGTFCFGVHDEGPGIHPDELQLVQETFGQGAEGKSRPGSGTGLGLAIVKGLIEAHGGEFILKSKVDVGTQAEAIFPSSRVKNADSTRRIATRARYAYP